MSNGFRVYILDWKDSPNARTAEVEQEALGDVGRVEICFVNDESEIPDDVLAADALIIWYQVRVTEKTVGNLKNCRVIVRNGVGYDNIDIDTACKLNIPVCSVPDSGTEEIADHTVALALALGRRIVGYSGAVKSGKWGWDMNADMQRLRGKVYGIIGMGPIGTAVAVRMKAFGMTVAFFDPYKQSGYDKSLGIVQYRNLDNLLRDADFISVHCPSTEKTRNLIGAKELEIMKPTAYLVNTARGPIIDEDALVAALKENKIAGAGLDVFKQEPPANKELLALDNLVATPHAAFYSVEAFEECRRSSALRVREALLGEQLLNIVNGVVPQTG